MSLRDYFRGCGKWKTLHINNISLIVVLSKEKWQYNIYVYINIVYKTIRYISNGIYYEHMLNIDNVHNEAAGQNQ